MDTLSAGSSPRARILYMYDKYTYTRGAWKPVLLVENFISRERERESV